MKKVLLIFGYIRDITETTNANVFVTMICQLLCQYWNKNSIDADKLLMGIRSGESGAKFDNRTNHVSRGFPDFHRASNGVAAKIQFQYASQRILTSRTIWLQKTNNIASLEVLILGWRPFGSAVQRRCGFFYPPAPDGIGVSVRPCRVLVVVEVKIGQW